jgi:hypothetical protein
MTLVYITLSAYRIKIKLSQLEAYQALGWRIDKDQNTSEWLGYVGKQPERDLRD